MASLLRNRIVLTSGLIVLLAIAGRALWGRYGDVVRQEPRYRLSAETLEVTPQPVWIHRDVKQAAMELGELDQRSLLDRDLIDQVRDAFQVQTWVAEVTSIRKSPAGVQVELKYREPVAMVEIVADGAPKLQPVDGEGVLLPGSEFARAQIDQYLRIAVWKPRVHGLIDGTQWPDERVVQAAAVARQLSQLREPLDLFRVNLLRPPTDGRRPEATFEVQTRSGHRIVWGAAPGVEILGEAELEEKLTALAELKATLDKLPESGPKLAFDIRTGSTIQVASDAVDDQDRSSLDENPWGIGPR